MSAVLHPRYSTAVLLPALAFPAIILDIGPLIWHYWQRNIAAVSLILWVMIINLFNAINPLIWPRDNILEWWNGGGLCDVEVRVFVGSTVALPMAVAMTMRKLAMVMDTRNITVSPSHRTRVKEKLLEILWCWVFPVVMMMVYYIVQPSRYFLFGIAGCVAAFDSSWPSVVLVWMWGPICTCVAAFYGVLLMYRLYRYRREFVRLISASDTTKSRFIRLTVMCLILIVLYVPYSSYILYWNSLAVTDKYDWSRVHGPDWNSVIKVPSAGIVRFDKWGQVANGYVAFLVFGTGTDANNTYKRMLRSIGLGRFFPRLYNVSESGVMTPSSISSAAIGWFTKWSSKTKSILSRTGSVTETLPIDTRSGSIANVLSPTKMRDSYIDPLTPTTACSESLHPVSTNDQMLGCPPSTSNKTSFLGSLFARHDRKPVLPIFERENVNDVACSEKSPCSPTVGVYSRAWASPCAYRTGVDDNDGVHIVQEVRQDCRQLGNKEHNPNVSHQ